MVDGGEIVVIQVLSIDRHNYCVFACAALPKAMLLLSLLSLWLVLVVVWRCW